MKRFDKPHVCITQEEYDQLLQCKIIATKIWQEYAWSNKPWPKELTERWAEYPDKSLESVQSRLEELNNFDDSE